MSEAISMIFGGFGVNPNMKWELQRLQSWWSEDREVGQSGGRDCVGPTWVQLL